MTDLSEYWTKSKEFVLLEGDFGAPINCQSSSHWPWNARIYHVLCSRSFQTHLLFHLCVNEDMRWRKLLWPPRRYCVAFSAPTSICGCISAINWKPYDKLQVDMLGFTTTLLVVNVGGFPSFCKMFMNKSVSVRKLAKDLMKRIAPLSILIFSLGNLSVSL